MNVGEGETRCFWMEPSGEVSITLRRFVFGLADGEEERASHRACPAAEPYGGYTTGCDASSGEIARAPLAFDRESYEHPTMAAVPEELRPPHDDPRWPTVCERCGGTFRDDDQWQVNQTEVYLRSDTGAEVVSRGYNDPDAKGGLLDVWWRHGMGTKDGLGYVGADGIALGAVCPNGLLWEVDGPATGGGRWTRRGDPRVPETLSVSPSIIAGNYHGFLQAGRFTGHVG